jgi:hypothetical protein
MPTLSEMVNDSGRRLILVATIGETGFSQIRRRIAPRGFSIREGIRMHWNIIAMTCITHEMKQLPHIGNITRLHNSFWFCLAHDQLKISFKKPAI